MSVHIDCWNGSFDWTSAFRKSPGRDEAACILQPLPRQKQSSIDLGHINTGDWEDLYLVLPKGVVSLAWYREEGGCPAEEGSRRVS